MEYIRKIVSINLKALRGELPASKVADACGISQSSYSRYESNGWIADYEALEKLAIFYGVRSSRFFYDPDLDKPPTDSLKPHLSHKEIKKKLIELIDLLE